MLLSIGIVLILGIGAGYLFEKMKLPDLLGMIILGIIIGPYGLKILDKQLLDISNELRKIALIIILLRAGLGINIAQLRKVGIPALKLSCIPGLLEGFAIMIASIFILDFNYMQGGTMGFIIAAVSPAIVVPAMLSLMANKDSRNNEIGTLVLTGASLDDVFAITICNIFISLYFSKNVNIARELVNIPISIFLGLTLGIVFAKIVGKIFLVLEDISIKTVLLLATSLIMVGIEAGLKNYINIASLIGVMALGFFIAKNLKTKELPDINEKFNNLWKIFKVFLFVLIGAEINILVLREVGPLAILIILIGLVFRSIGVLISLVGTNYKLREKLFMVVAYIPKATVQAAMAGLPLSMGMENGDVILSIAVLSIIITAPIGAIAIEKFSQKL